MNSCSTCKKVTPSLIRCMCAFGRYDKNKIEIEIDMSKDINIRETINMYKEMFKRNPYVDNSKLFVPSPSMVKIYNKCRIKAEYNFAVQNPEMINYKEVKQELNRTNPIAYITLKDKEDNVKKLVVIHHSVLQKAYLLEIALPESVNEIISGVFELTYINDQYEPKFREITKWVKDVIAAEWGMMKDETKVNITIPNI